MKTKIHHLLFVAIFGGILLTSFSCSKNTDDDDDDDDKKKTMVFSKAKIGVNFNSPTSNKRSADDIIYTKQTPAEYIIALKSATIIGEEGTEDYELFNVSTIDSSLVYDFTDGSVRHDLGADTTIPEGFYGSMNIELYYLQMKLQIYSINRGVEWRNLRIYFSDDGVHRPADVTQIDDEGNELGWLFGNGVIPDFDPVSPREAAYTIAGNGVQWLMFADKSAQYYGPFGNMDFWNQATQPFRQNVPFNFEGSSGDEVVMMFNVAECWQFEDKTRDGYFGGDDITFDANPTGWHMAFPAITIVLE